jgi:flagellar hook-length control protein FliK
MIFSQLGLMHANTGTSRESLQGPGTEGAPAGKDAQNAANFLQMLVRAAGSEGGKVPETAGTGGQSQVISDRELEELLGQIIDFLEKNGLSAGILNSAFDRDRGVDMPGRGNSSGQARVLENLLVNGGFGQSPGQGGDLTAVFEDAMNSGPDSEIRRIMAQIAGGPAGQDSRSETGQSLRVLLQSLVDNLKSAQKNVPESGGQAGRIDSQGGSQATAERSYHLMPEIQAVLKNSVQGQGAAGATNAGLSADTAMQALQEFAAKTARGNELPEDTDSLRVRLQAAEKSNEFQLIENSGKTAQTTRPQQESGSDNLRAMLDSLVSSNMEKAVAAERTENRQNMLKDGGGPAGANMNTSATTTGLFERVENAANVVQPGGASFDSQVKAAESQVVNQVSVRLFTGVRQGSGNMTIQIHPPELGSVKVRIVSDQGSLNVHLHPQNQQVAAILERHLPALHQSLADQGIDLSGLQVSVDSGTDQNASGFEDQEGDFPADQRSFNREAESDENRLSQSADSGDPTAYNQGSGLSLRV